MRHHIPSGPVMLRHSDGSGECGLLRTERTRGVGVFSEYQQLCSSQLYLGPDTPIILCIIGNITELD